MDIHSIFTYICLCLSPGLLMVGFLCATLGNGVKARRGTLEYWQFNVGWRTGYNSTYRMVQLSFLIFLTRVRLRIFLCLSYLYLGPRHFDDPGVLGTAAGPGNAIRNSTSRTAALSQQSSYGQAVLVEPRSWWRDFGIIEWSVFAWAPPSHSVCRSGSGDSIDMENHLGE